MSAPALLARPALISLLLAQLLAIAPHLLHLPLWSILLWLACAGWRLQVLRMRLRLPNAWARAGLLLLTCVAVASSRSMLSLDGAVLLLVSAISLKLVELQSRRDALLLVMLGFFMVVTTYLYQDGPLAALYSLLPVLVLLASLVALQSRAGNLPLPAALRLAGSLLLQAVPLMLLLFVLFPRLGPLWSLPTSQRAISGLAESMTPADIAELSRSAEPVFRVSFDGAPPARSQLYWRALTLELFDGGRWSQGPQLPAAAAPDWRVQGPPLDYSLVMQASGQPWLFALDVAAENDADASMRRDFRLQRRQPVMSPLIYRVRSWPQAEREPQLPQAQRQLALQLPARGDARSREWAGQLRREQGGDAELVAALLAHFNREPYHYTLKPPPLGVDSIDDFLFRTRSGFCAHYAGAMTFVLRAAGIPARVVAGYQGGELHPQRNDLTVRQLDAHAWVEYWLPERGWQSVDPTYQVAPERIDLGAELALADDEGYLQASPFSALRYRDLAWLNQARMAWEDFNYGWQRWVLGYQGEQQLGLLQRWFGTLDWQQLGLGLLAACAAVLGLSGLCLFKPWRRSRDPQLRALHRFERRMRRHGLQRGPGEGLRAFAERAMLKRPAQAEAIRAFVQLLEAQRYAGQPADPAALERALTRL